MAMMIKSGTYAVCARSLARDERGSPAVEFAMIAPVLILLIFAIVQFGFAFFTYNDMFNGAREGARRMAVGVTDAVAVERARSSMVLGRAYDVYADPATTPGADDVTMTVELKLSDAMVVSILPLPDSITQMLITASVTMRKEY